MRNGRNKLESIAREARCSVPTVSRALRGQSVKPANRERIVAAMHRLNYGEFVQYKIGLVVPDSANPYFAELAFAFERELERYNAQVLITSSEGRVDREVKLIRRFLGLQVDGLIYVPTIHGSEGLLGLVAQGKLPVLVFDRKLAVGNFDFITVSSKTATLRAVQCLRAAGHTKVGYISGTKGTFTATERLQSFRDAASASGLQVEDAHIFDGEYSLESGKKIAEQLGVMDALSRPTAIMAANDLMAIGLIHGLLGKGWDVPGAMSVVGFDNIEWSQWTNPALATIAQPLNGMVSQASERLIGRIEATKAFPLPPETYTADATFLHRASVAEHKK